MTNSRKGRNSRTITIRVSLLEYATIDRSALMANKGESVGLYCKRKLLAEGIRKHRRASPVKPSPEGET